MDGKLIYILIIIAYGIYSSYAKNKKEAEKKKSIEEKKLNPSGSNNQQTVIEKPTPAATSWEELIRTITQEAQNKKQEVKKTIAKSQTDSQKSQAAYNKKKKSVQEKVFVPMNVDEANVNERSADELAIDVMRGIPDEGISTTITTKNDMYEIKPYDFKEEDISYQLNAREALIQSVILTRPNY